MGQRFFNQKIFLKLKFLDFFFGRNRFSFGIIFLFVLSCFTGKENEKVESEVNEKKQDSASTEIVTLNIINKDIQKFSFDVLDKATDKFKIKNFLGEGGFGRVYRGFLSKNQVCKNFNYCFECDLCFCQCIAHLCNISRIELQFN